MSNPKGLHVERLQEAIKKAAEFRSQGLSSWTSAFKAWREKTIQSLAGVGAEAGYRERFESLGFNEPHVSPDIRLFDSKPGTFDEDLQLAQDVIKDALEDLPAIKTPEKRERGLGDIDSIREAQRIYNPGLRDPKPSTIQSPISVPGRAAARRVFLVHGKDEELKATVARFLEKLKLNPIILHEQPNQGQTLIEKFEANSDVDFAVVLLTPDDMGYPSDEPSHPRHRARQNVVFELGYFFGRIGRGRVCALYKGGMDLPSDVHGVVYIPFEDPQGWQLLLSREIKAAGINVDLNLAL